MTDALYMNDSYLKEWDTSVLSISKEIYIILKETAFYPKGGGVEWDTGTLTTEDGTIYDVVYTGKFSENISHEVNKKGLNVGDKVHCSLDWNRRYRLMRYHTAAHLLSGMFYQLHGLKVTGNQLTTEKGRIDLNMEEMDVSKISDVIDESNALITKDLPVEITYLSREQAREDPTLFKLAKGFSEDIKTIRIVDIKGFDRQADGGCHVRSLKEIGVIKFLHAKSKGKQFKRVYFSLQ